MTPAGDPPSDLIRGAVAGGLDWSAPRIAELVARLRGHSAAVASDGVLVESIRRASRGEEAQFLRTYVTDRDQRRIVDDGLTLHELSDRPEHHDRMQRLRSDLFRRYRSKGLRAAEVVERGVLSLFIRHLMRVGRSREEIRSSAFALLDTVERWTYFVQVETENTARVVDEVRVRVLANQPGTFVILAHGNQRAKGRTIVAALLRRLGDDFGVSTNDTGREFVAFVGRSEGDEFELTVPA